MKQQRAVTFFREVIKSEDVDTSDIEDKVNDKHAVDIKKKESQE